MGYLMSNPSLSKNSISTIYLTDYDGAVQHASF